MVTIKEFVGRFVGTNDGMVEGCFVVGRSVTIGLIEGEADITKGFGLKE